MGQVNRPAPDIRPPVRNAHPHRFAIGEVGHLDRRPERERAMSRTQPLLVIAGPAGRGVTVKPRPIPRGNPKLPTLGPG